MATNHAWLAALPAELGRQRRALAELARWCEGWPLALALAVGCSLGRGAADALSDIDGALGLDAPPGEAGAATVGMMEARVAAALPELGPVVDVLRHQVERPGQHIRRVFAQFADGTQLDLAILALAGIEARHAGGGAPDFVWLYRADGVAGDGLAAGGPVADDARVAYAVTGEQVREWAFLGWCALIDADKYLRRGSAWEAHARLEEARNHVWALWAAARGAMYPWHGLSQVLDQDPADLPPGIEATVAGLDLAALRAAARACASVLTLVSRAAAARHPASLPGAMGAYVTAALARDR
ncbi:MAG TPA: hypothetical protein VH478_05255 [Trebonia sp.]|jgi:hypothetical protein|nr:hypothetical protein [Trebonia sp.]